MMTNPTTPVQAGWAAVREFLLQYVRESEEPLFSSRVANVHRVLVIESCLGMPLLDALHRTASDKNRAIVASNRSEMCGSVPTSSAGLIAAGSLEQIQLPNGWAEGILGHCVLDELHSPRVAFAELARTAASGATICLSGPASVGALPTRVAGVRATVWPMHQLIDGLCESGFASVATSDLTAKVVERLPQDRHVAFGFSADVRWIVLEGQRRPTHA